MVKRWRRLLWVLLVVLCLVACAPATVQPTAAPEPTVAPTITPDASQPLKLVLPGSNQPVLISVNRHYSAVVQHMGWNIDFYTVQQDNGNGMDSYLEYVAKQLESGVAKADGYIMYFALDPSTQALLDKAKSGGLLYDCVAAAPQAVPKYWAQFKDTIVAAQYGLPLCYPISSSYANWQQTFAVREDVQVFAPKGIRDYDDIRDFAKSLQTAQPEGAFITADDGWTLINLWAQQQGYLELFPGYGIYARLDDPDVEPVWMEDIPGCEKFLKDIATLRAASTLLFSPLTMQHADGPKPAGFIERVGFITSPYVSMSLQDYYAYPLVTDSAYCADMNLAYSMKNRLNSAYELLIPAKSRRAADAMAFVQWLYASQDNAESVIFGQQGEDYTLQGQRIAISDKAMKAMTEAGDGYWPGSYLFSCADPNRIPVGAPQNSESLKDAWPVPKFAAPWLVHLNDSDVQGSFPGSGALEERRLQMTWLMNALQGNVVNDETPDVTALLTSLRSISTDDALQTCLEVLNKAKAKE